MTIDEEILEGETLQVAWRHDQLVALGLDDSTAEWVAHSTVDWHELERLIRSGCPTAVAVKILT